MWKPVKKRGKEPFADNKFFYFSTDDKDIEKYPVLQKMEDEIREIGDVDSYHPNNYGLEKHYKIPPKK